MHQVTQLCIAIYQILVAICCVPKNLTYTTEHPPEDGADERRNASDYQLNSVTCCMSKG